MKIPYRVGFGYDVHSFEEGRKLILGGVQIPFNKGLKGHSDADALLHAICDAMLGALALGDIGQHFPDTDSQYEGIDSKILLKETYEIIRAMKYKIGNVDSTIVIEKPKMAPHINEMRSTIAGILDCEVNQISIKATTSEKMGFVGNQEGVKVLATALLICEED